jgi:hypothetical protein
VKLLIYICITFQYGTSLGQNIVYGRRYNDKKIMKKEKEKKKREAEVGGNFAMNV